MKFPITIILFLVSFSAMSSEDVCYGKEGSCMRNRDLICGRVIKLDDQTYRVENLVRYNGCMMWGVSKLKSKNKICKNILKKFGETRKVKYARNSWLSGRYTTLLDNESVGQIDCEMRN